MNTEKRKPGRPKIVAPLVRLTVAVNKTDMEKIVAMSEQLSYSQAETVRSLIKKGLSDMEYFV